MSAPSRRPCRMHRSGTRPPGERGAAAVEFALVIPVLLLLLMGIVEYSKAYSAQSTLAASAREAVRVMAVSNSAGSAYTAARTAAGPLALSSSAISFRYSRSGLSSCSGSQPGDTVTVTIAYRQPFASGLLGRTGVTLTGTASMRCGG